MGFGKSLEAVNEFVGTFIVLVGWGEGGEEGEEGGYQGCFGGVCV